MEKINKHNYEAYFLDFAEGNLSAEGIIELNTFLNQNPELKDELEGFEVVELQNTHQQKDKWSGLKKPTIEILRDDAEIRDAFFLRAVEKQLTPHEAAMLNELLTDSSFKREYALWEKIILLPGSENLRKDSLYQFGLDRPISEFNYDYFLIARAEGLLTSEQNAALEKYSSERPNGARELAIADNLKLEPARGIFYPDKKALYKKEKVAIVFWLYRAAAIAAVLLIGVFIWNQYNGNSVEKAQVAKHEDPKITKPVSDDSLTKSKVNVQDSVETMENNGEPSLQEWEVREPDFVEYAEAKSNPAPSQNPKDNQLEAKNIPESVERVETENLRAEIEMPELIEDSLIRTEQIPEYSTEQKDNLASAKPNAPTEHSYKTIPELAGDLLAQKLSIPDSEKDEMAMAIAKRITSRAGELLDSEYKKESSKDDETLTYSLRVGSFKLSRTRSK